MALEYITIFHKSLTKNRCSAADISLFRESFVGFISSVDVEPKYGHFITFNTDSKSLNYDKITENHTQHANLKIHKFLIILLFNNEL